MPYNFSIYIVLASIIFTMQLVQYVFSIVHHTSLNWPRLPHNGGSRGWFYSLLPPK
jgi:hypothetical protein